MRPEGRSSALGRAVSAPRALVAALAAVFLSHGAAAGPADFDAPVDVIIDGYDGHAMEPFASRDGAWLFFNNRNTPEDQTDIHVASRLDDTHFAYRGVLAGVASEALDGVPSMDRQGRFYFVSPRAYDQTRNTLWRGQFSDGDVQHVEPLRGDAPRRRALWLNIDAEISPDGETLYFVESRWRLLRGGIKSANIFVAHRDETGAFFRPENAAALFAAINTKMLEFAPAITADQLTLYFTRVDRAALRRGRDDGFGLFVATRPEVSAPFGAPQRIAAIRGYVEAPALSPDECSLYFHQRVEGTFKIRMARKTACR